jgi:predicted nucleic acid-binding protein
MTVYLDTSAILGRLLAQTESLDPWGGWEAAYTSALTRTEFLRTIDRLRLQGDLTDDERVAIHQGFQEIWECCHRIALDSAILEKAAAPMPTVVGTLDAIHVVTVYEVKAWVDGPLEVATHDRKLGRAAEALGLAVRGLSAEA